MDELDLLATGRIPTDLFGVLDIITTMIYIDYPLAFICRSSSGRYFAFLENEDLLTTYGWNVTEVSLSDIKLVNDGTANIQSLFLNHLCYLAKGTIDSDVIHIEKIDSFDCDPQYEIQGDLYTPRFCDFNKTFNQ